jgi:hypothetical protein
MDTKREDMDTITQQAGFKGRWRWVPMGLFVLVVCLNSSVLDRLFTSFLLVSPLPFPPQPAFDFGIVPTDDPESSAGRIQNLRGLPSPSTPATRTFNSSLA